MFMVSKDGFHCQKENRIIFSSCSPKAAKLSQGDKPSSFHLLQWGEKGLFFPSCNQKREGRGEMSFFLFNRIEQKG